MSNPVEALTIIGWFNDAADTIPAFDPGLDVPCPLCGVALHVSARVTISVCPRRGTRSLFFRAHQACWVSASVAQRSQIESEVVDCEVGHVQ